MWLQISDNFPQPTAATLNDDVTSRVPWAAVLRGIATTPHRCAPPPDSGINMQCAVQTNIKYALNLVLTLFIYLACTTPVTRLPSTAVSVQNVFRKRTQELWEVRHSVGSWATERYRGTKDCYLTYASLASVVRSIRKMKSNE